MNTRSTLSESDEGKQVVDADGQAIGVLSNVDGRTVQINPNHGFAAKIRATLNWGDDDEDTYSLSTDSIANVTDDEVRLERVP